MLGDDASKHIGTPALRKSGRAPAAAIFGLEGDQLNADEKDFFAESNPLGFILFARNCKNPEQLRRLTDSLKECVGREDVWILIDQEGGRVARLRPPYWRDAPPAGAFAAMMDSDPEQAREATYINARLMARELIEYGINVNCAPVADLRIPGAHDIIGDRAYGETPAQVAELGRQMAEGLLDGGVLPVLKHIPGHGRALADSHEALPVVDAPLDVLNTSDFLPFMTLRHLPLGMTAHILYTAIDPDIVLTLSSKGIDFIRRQIGFGGLLMTDDLGMKALNGKPGELAQRAMVAGCDVALHCSGKMNEMDAIMEEIGTMGEESYRRVTQAEAQLARHREKSMARAFDMGQAEAKLLKWLGLAHSDRKKTYHA